MTKLVRLKDDCHFVKTINQNYSTPIVITHAWTEVPDDFVLSSEMEEHPDTKKTVKVVESKKEETVSKEPEVEKYAKETLFSMTKAEQVALIKELAGKDAVIPRYEKDRVALILKLQK